MRAFLQKNHRFTFYLLWLVLGLIQSGFTELMDDEAYYWVYSKFLDWGYFDHPPMIALLIRMGWSVFHGELGVRLFPLLLNLLSLMIIERLIERKNIFLFYAIVLSLAVLQIAGFVAVPDTPLIFFTAVFLLIYRNFLVTPSNSNTVLLGVAAAALLYSKYHAVLIIFFLLMSNPKLFLRYRVYIAGIIAFLLFFPHLWWQYQHDWISFRYHLFESNVNDYKFSFTLEYLGGQILLAGPFAGFILLPAAFLYKTRGEFERGLKFVMAGIYIFFLLSSFRGRVEANWTSPAIAPLIILSHNFLIERPGWRKWLLRLLPLTMLVVLVARIAMIVDILPVKEIQRRYHAWKSWPDEMRKITGDRPIVFNNSYQRASKYWFYSGQMTYSLNMYRERRNNYNFWPIEDSILGKAVYLLDVHNLDSFQNKMKTPIGMVGYSYDSSWASFAKIRLVLRQNTMRVKTNEAFSIPITPTMPQAYYNYVVTHPKLPTKIVIGVFDKEGWVKDLPVPYSLSELITARPVLNVEHRLKKGNYFMIFSIYAEGTLSPTHNSEKIKLVVE